MGVGDAQELEHALNDAVLAEAPVQRVEGHVRLQFGEPLRGVQAHVQTGHLKAFGFERPRAGLPGAQRNLAFGGETAHQHGDMSGHGKSLSGRISSGGVEKDRDLGNRSAERGNRLRPTGGPQAGRREPSPA